MPIEIDWEIRLGFLIHDVSRLRRVAFDRALRPWGTTRSQWWVLAFLSRDDGMPQTKLADELDLGKVALGGLVDRLESAGLVERRPEPEDRRVKRVFLTSAGRHLVGEMRKLNKDVNRLILAGIPPADRESCARALEQMKENLLGELTAAEKLLAAD